MPLMPHALVGFREVRAIYTSNSVIEMSLRVNACLRNAHYIEIRCIYEGLKIR